MAPSSRTGTVYTLQCVDQDAKFTHVLDWNSRKQRHVSLSSAQAETIALNLTTRESVSITATLREMYQGRAEVHTPFILSDAASALAAVRRGWSRSLSACSRAVGTAVSWLHDEAAADTTRFGWLSGKDNPADSLTKPVSSQACVLVPLMTTWSEEEKTWVNAATRKDGARYQPKTSQPEWTRGAGPCFLCTQTRPLCHRCKLCLQCGCECKLHVDADKTHPLLQDTQDEEGDGDDADTAFVQYTMTTKFGLSGAAMEAARR